jgi:ZIP family zinc transporter/zinc and cadmium transporter
MNFSGVLIYSLIAGGAAILGTAIVFFFERWAHENSIFLISFGAGVMLAIAFLDLIPEAASACGNSWIMVFIGFLLLYILQNIIMVHPCHDEDCKTHLGVLSTVGFSIHSLLDGVIVSVGFAGGLVLGALTAVAVILHKLPDGITITGILVHSGASRKKILIFSVFVALLTPLGAAASYFFLRNLPAETYGILIALTAGSFIYLAASDLLPESHKIRHNGNAVSFFAGVIIVAFIGRFLHI